MDRISTKQLATLPIEFKLNGKTVIGRPDEPIIETARQNGITIPHLCYSRTLRPDGNCRACVVEVKGERVLAPSCCRFPTQGMEVTTDSPRALASQKMVLELLLSDMPEKQYTLNNKVDVWARKLGVGKPRFEARKQPKADISHPGIAVNLDACIQCTRCLRACREEQVNDVIGYAFRGEHSKIVFDQDDPMGASTCVACGECVQACPTGALMPAREAGLEVVDKKVDSVCPFCGVGCQLTYHVQKESERHQVRHRPRRPVEPRPPVRQGPLRLRLRAASAAADQAADPETGMPKIRPFHRRSGQLEGSLPRGQLGRSS